MNEPIVVARNRKTGKWEILCDPDKTFSEAGAVFEKIDPNLSDDYSRVIIARLQHSRPTKNPITKTEFDKRVAAQTERTEKVQQIVAEARDRAKSMEAEREKHEALSHAEHLARANAIVEQVRKASGQKPAAPEPAPKKKAGDE